MKTPKSAPVTKSIGKKKSSTEEIKTDLPLSEKDEVKKAEQNTNKSVKKHSK